MEVQQITKISLAWELFRQGVPKSHIANNLGISRETAHIWIASISAHPNGLIGFLEAYKHAKSGPRAKRKIDGLIKVKVWALREQNRGCCGQKIQEYLWQQEHIHLSVVTIYKILSEKYQLRSKWKKNQIRGVVPKAHKPREVIQMDSVDFGYIFAFTGIDIFSKDVCVELFPSLTSLDGFEFLTNSMEKRYKHSDMIQVDGGPEFKGEFKKNVFNFADRFRVARTIQEERAELH